MTLTYSLIIIIFTVLVSISAFSNSTMYDKMILWPKRMAETNEYYRLLTSGFIHADYMHLFFNMLALYFFGSVVEQYYQFLGLSRVFFLLLYFGGIVASSLPSYIKHRENGYYRSLGASGGVSAVLFAFVYFAPWQTIYIWFIPVPGIIAAVGYVIYSAYMSKQGRGYINHDAHLWGAVFGFMFTLLFAPDHGKIFLYQLLRPEFNF